MNKMWKVALIASVPLVAAMGVAVVNFTPQDAWAGAASASVAQANRIRASASAPANASASVSSFRLMTIGIYGTR